MAEPTASEHTTTVLIVAEVRLYREGLAERLASSSRLAVVGACGSGSDAREQARRAAPDVILVDVAATDGSLELIRELRADGIRSKVLAFAIEENAADVIECAEAGATGYVAADASIDDLIKAIEKIARAELVCSPRIAATLFGLFSERRQSWPADPRTLTTRERQVLDCIRQGQSNKEIAQRLNIAETTVKNHVHHLLEKLDVSSRAQAAARVPLSSGRRHGRSSSGL